MNIIIDSHELEVDPWLADYVRTTVLFAVWHQGRTPETVRVEVSVDKSNSMKFACALRASDSDPNFVLAVAAGSGKTICEAVQLAADRLEVELLRSQLALASLLAGPELDEERRAA